MGREGWAGVDRGSPISCSRYKNLKRHVGRVLSTFLNSISVTSRHRLIPIEAIIPNEGMSVGGEASSYTKENVTAEGRCHAIQRGLKSLCSGFRSDKSSVTKKRIQ